MSHKHNFTLKFLSFTVFSLMFAVSFLMIRPYANAQQQPAYDPPDLSGCSAADKYKCPIGQTCSCPESTFDWCGNQDNGDCSCVNKPTNGQVTCEHTICPPGYTCRVSDSSRSCSGSYCISDSGSTPPGNPPIPGVPTSTPTLSPTPVITAMCQDVKAYTQDWVLHTPTTLATLQSGNTVYFCARGSTNLGTFTKARFTINSLLRPETTTIRPSTINEYCDLYTIPVNTYNFEVSGEMFHSTLGWIQ